MPVLTVNAYGDGKAYYVGTHSDEEFYQTFFDRLCTQAGIRPVHQTPFGVEASVRENENGTFLFLLNHTTDKKTVVLDGSYEDLLDGRIYQCQEETVLEKKGVQLLRKI